MPLIAKLPQAGEHFDSFESPPLHVHHQLEQVREEQESTTNRFDDFDDCNDQEDVLDSDMEGSILHRPRPKKPVKAPVLPQRSEKRASKILEGVMQELKHLEEKPTKAEAADRMSLVQESDPHEQYLSSEEDASLSDDYEGSLMDFEESEGEDTRGRQSSRSSRRKSQEDTARMVSFMVVGKPQIVNIFTISPTSSLPPSRHSMNLDALTSFKTKSISASPPKPTARRPPPLTLYSDSRRMSISSTTSYIPPSASPPAPPPMRHPNASTSNLSMVSHNSNIGLHHPARKSSRLGFSNLTSLVTNHSSSRKASFNSQANPTPITASSTHSFLNSDPFAHNVHAQEANHNLPPSPSETPTTPKTPNSLASWKKGLTRTLSKARKPSMPKLAQAYQSHAASSSTLSLASTSTSHTHHPRSSTSHGPHSTSTIPTLSSFPSSNSISNSNPKSQSTTSLARITSNPEPPTPKLLDTTGSTMREQMAVKRSETMPIIPSPRDSAPPNLGGRYEDIMRSAMRGPPPIPDSESDRRDSSAKSVKDWRRERRSFGLMGGLGRKKSVKK